MTHRTHASHGCRLLAPAACLALLTSSPAHADDSDFFQESIPPNVLVLIDSSFSMREIMYHPEFDTADNTTCSIFGIVAPNAGGPNSGSGDLDDDGGDPTEYKCDTNTQHCRFELDQGSHSDFVETETVSCPGGGSKKSGYYTRTFCGRTRNLYVDGATKCVGGDTWYSEWYVEWLFSPASDAYLLGSESNTSTDADMIDANENGVDFLTNDRYPLFKQTRLTAAKQVTEEVIYQVNSDCGAGAAASCTSFSDRVRFGIAEFDKRDGGFVSAAIDDYSNNQDDIEDALEVMKPDDSTPLSEALFKTYTYFMSRNDAELPTGDDDTTVFPKYVYRESDGTNDPGNAPPDPIECPDGSTNCPCQKNFVILISDGDPFNDNFTTSGAGSSSTPETQGFDDFDALIGDYNDDGELETVATNPALPANSNSTLYLDDISKYMQENDFRPLDTDQEGEQVIDVYTVGFHLDEATVGGALLKKTAEVANGDFFFGTQASEIRQALMDSITEIIEKSQSFTAATVPASRTTDGNNFYSTYFRPRKDSPFWEGHLKNFKFTIAGDILTADDECAIGDPGQSAPCPSGGLLRTSADGVWDAGEEVPAPASRQLFVGGTGTYGDTPPVWSAGTLDAALLGLDVAASSRLTEEPYELPDPPSASELEDLADDLVSNIAGCEFGTTLGVDCTQRTNEDGVVSLLGDIFHSNPVVVGSPNSRINDPDYKIFARDDFRTRDAVIYAASNDGWVHGFLAGEWQSSFSPPGHDRGETSGRGGEELFGFMPSEVREKIWQLPLSSDASGRRDFYGPDGSAAAADVWIYRTFNDSDNSFGSVLSPPVSTHVDKVPEQWRTVLIGGLREGGRSYYALDVTDPSGSTYAYPGYLWEFPCDDCTINPGSVANLAGLGTMSPADYLGETWSDPVITRVRVKVNGQLGAHDRWVAVVGGGYDVCGDPNTPEYSDTGAGGACDATTEASRRGRAIMMIDITTGELLAAKFFSSTHAPPDHTTSPPGTPQLARNDLRYAFASQPAVFDVNFDGYADVIYIGDLGGNLWKWVVKPVGDDPIHNTGTDDSLGQPDWPFYPFFTADDHSGTHFQSLFFPPTATLKGGTLFLAFGAGERADPDAGAIDATTDDYLDADNNHFYVLKDDDPFATAVLDTLTEAPPPTPAGDLIPIDLVDDGTKTCSDIANAPGYFLTARDREKFITNAVIFLGEVITGSFLPADPSAHTCGVTGEAFLYRFDLGCGDGAYGDGSTPAAEKRRKAIGGGLPSRPRVSIGDLNSGGNGGGCTNKVVVITSDGGIENDCPGSLPSSGVQIRSWRSR